MKRLNRDRVLSLTLFAPSVAAVSIFVYGMIGWTIFVSQTKWDSLNEDFTSVGLKNFLSIFGSIRFQYDIRNTIVFTICFVAVSILLGLLLANLIDRKIRAEGFFRSVFLFPMAISFIVTGVVWKWLLSPGQGGAANGINQLFGFAPGDHKWFTDPSIISIATDSPVGKVLHDVGLGFLASTQFGIPVAMLSIVIAAVWQMSGFVMVLYLSAMRAIPDELREAARVDGATEYGVFRHVVLPLLTPVTLSAMIILGHISLKIFDLTAAMSPHGPGFATDVPAMQMWEIAFGADQFAKGAAIAVVMLALVAVVIVPYLIWTRRQEVAA